MSEAEKHVTTWGGGGNKMGNLGLSHIVISIFSWKSGVCGPPAPPGSSDCDM